MRGTFRVALVALVALLATRTAHADGPLASVDPRILSANPDSPVSLLAWRSQLRGKVAIVIPLVGRPMERGLVLRVPAFIELHNVDGSAIPSELWRGRIVADASYGWQANVGARFFFRTGAALEHESDHTSVARYVGFSNLNSLALRNEATFDLGRGLTLFISPVTRIHLHTCTRSSAYCAIDGGSRGTRAFEAAIDATVVKELATLPALGDLHGFLSLHGAWLFPHDTALEEQRVTSDVGVALATPRAGTFQILATML